MDSIIIFLTGFTGLTGFFFACGASPFGRRPLYPDDPVDPVRKIKLYMLSFLFDICHAGVSFSIKPAVFLSSGGAHMKFEIRNLKL